MKKWSRILYIVVSVVLLISIWQIVIFIGGYEEALLPSPITVGKGIITLIVTGTIFEHVGISLMRFFIGYFSAVIAAVILGLILGRTKRIWQVLDPIVQVIRPVAPIAWAPFIVLWFGMEVYRLFLSFFFPLFFLFFFSR